MMKHLIILALLVSIGCSKKYEKGYVLRLNGSRIMVQELGDRINSLVDIADVTGFTATIFNQGTVVYQKAFGYSNYESKDSLHLDQVFYGASLSKSVFGYLVALLANDGIIDPDRPLQEYLDVPIYDMQFEKEWWGFKNLAGDERYKMITARMCLSHTTGFPNWRWISRIGEFQPEGKIHFYFDPGTEYSYSGEGILLLQYVVEKITGKGLEQLAREIIFDPLEMNMTSYVWQKRFENNYCNGHTTEGEVIEKDINDEAGAAGSMETTPMDYAKLMENILSLYSKNSPVTNLMFTPNIRIYSKKQFGPESLEKTDENDDIELSYGLGWGILKSRYGQGFFKEGHGEGFQHYSILFPERQIGVLLMSNSDNAESIFKEVLEVSIGDIFTPWQWENYIPYDL